MAIIDTINKRLLKRQSKNSNINRNSIKTTTNKAYGSYISLFNRNDDWVDYETGKSILRDTQVGTGFDILKYLLSSKKWILTNTEEEDTEVYDFINEMLQNMTIEINTIVKQMTTAIMWGFSVHELIYTVENGRLIIKNIVPVHIKTLQDEPFVFNDSTGELEYIHQEIGGETVDIPLNKVLLYSFNSLFDEVEGNGLLYDFQPIVEDKDNLMDWLMTFNEKNELPTIYGKTDNPTSRDEMLDAFEDVADGEMGIVIGETDELGVLESSHRGETFFTTLQYKDNQIFRRMYIGNLLMGDNSQTGTYAQSQTQLEFGQLVFDGILEEYANVFQTQVINRIVEFNFGAERKAPVISFDKFTKGDMQKLFSILQPLISNGIVDSENSAVHEALTLLFKTEAGVEYTNTPAPEPKFEQETAIDETEDTQNLLDDLMTYE